MKRKIIIIAVSSIVAIALLSAGYGLWEDTLIIKGTVNVKKPDYVETIIPILPPENKSVTSVIYHNNTSDISVELTDISLNASTDNIPEAFNNKSSPESKDLGSSFGVTNQGLDEVIEKATNTQGETTKSTDN